MTTVLFDHSVNREACQWLNEFQERFPRFDTYLHHGISLLIPQEEMEGVLLLQNRGVSLLQSPNMDPVLRGQIQDRIKEIISDVHQIKKILSNKKKIKEEQRIIEKWRGLKLPDSILKTHPDCVRFLLSTHWAFDIVGFRNTASDSTIHTIQLDVDGHPLLRIEGKWQRWEEIVSQFRYNEDARCIESIDGRRWTYLHPDGLVPKERALRGERPFPIYQLSRTEYLELVKIADCCTDQSEDGEDILKDCVLQLITIPREKAETAHPLLRNFHNSLHSHVALRLVTAQGEVYSFGKEIPPDILKRVIQAHPSSSLLATIPGQVGMLDHIEFHRMTHGTDGKLVTSLPLSSKRAEMILSFLQREAEHPSCYQFGRHNCVAFATEILNLAGYRKDFSLPLTSLLYQGVFDLDQMPKVGRNIHKIQAHCKALWHHLPRRVTRPLSALRMILVWPLKKCATVLTNLIMLKLGAGKVVKSLPKGETLKGRVQESGVSSVMPSWADVVRDESNRLIHSKPLISWQRAQRSTFFSPGQEPRLTILPQQGDVFIGPLPNHIQDEHQNRTA